MKVGDKVVVTDPALAMLRRLVPEQPLNNVGWVHEIRGDEILVAFPLDAEEHFQIAPYPRNMVEASSPDGENEEESEHA